MECPTCGSVLIAEFHSGIEVDRCAACNGRWLDPRELDHLEARVKSTPEQRRATIQFARRESSLKCPVCREAMVAFNYRAYDLELDTCREEHGFWLDAGEEGRVQDIIQKRIRDLQRSAQAEAAWHSFLDGLRRGKRNIFHDIADWFAGTKS
jgi:Zn-finger nucleic acid-binding protein